MIVQSSSDQLSRVFDADGGIEVADGRSALTTTLAAIRAQSPCRDGWARLKKHVGDLPDDALLPLIVVLDSNGINDCLWVAYVVIGERARVALAAFSRECVLRACDHAERALSIYEVARPGDDQPRKAIEAARACAAGAMSTRETIRAAYGASRASRAAYGDSRAAAAAAADAAADAADAAARAADYAAYAARAAAADAADAAADAAAYAAAYAADAYAAYAAYADANAAAAAAVLARIAREHERAWQAARLREYLSGATQKEVA